MVAKTHAKIQDIFNLLQLKPKNTARLFERNFELKPDGSARTYR